MYVELEAHGYTTPFLVELFGAKFIVAHVESEEQHAYFLTRPLSNAAFCCLRDFRVNMRFGIRRIHILVSVGMICLGISEDDAVLPGNECRGFICF